MPIHDAATPQSLPASAPAVVQQPWFHLDRKVFAGGIGGVLAMVILGTASHFGYSLQPMADQFFGTGTINVLAVLTAVISFASSYLAPASVADVLTKLNLRIIALAVADQTHPVLSNITVPEIVKEVVKIGAPMGSKPDDKAQP